MAFAVLIDATVQDQMNTQEKGRANVAITKLAERLPHKDLHQRMLDALGPTGVQRHGPVGNKPLELDLQSPLPHLVRVYLYNATVPPGGRPLGEHKIQIIVPGQSRHERGNFDHGNARIVLLAGYASVEEVFILWDAGLYTDFAWSRNVQVKAETVIRASVGNIAIQERRLRPRAAPQVTEVLVAARADRLAEAILERIRLTRERMFQE